MNQKFQLNKIEVRGPQQNKGRYIVKGYAMSSNVPHTYATETTPGKGTRSFKSYFTPNFEASLYRQMQNKPIFVDALHDTGTTINVRSILDGLKKKDEKYSLGLDEEISTIEANLKMKELPLARVTDFKIDDNGLFVETELNPSFRELDDEHKRYFDAIWTSLEQKFIDGMSINFAATSTVDEEGIERIDDGEFFGISYMPGAALGPFSSITEVAVRAITEINRSGDGKMVEQTNNKELESLKSELAEMKKTMADKEASERQTRAESEAKNKEEELKRYQDQVAELKSQLEATAKAKESNSQDDETIGKGTVKKQAVEGMTSDGVPKNPSKEWWVEKSKELSWDDFTQLQATHPEIAYPKELLNDSGMPDAALLRKQVNTIELD